jgi:hypothetical protein
MTRCGDHKRRHIVPFPSCEKKREIVIECMTHFHASAPGVLSSRIDGNQLLDSLLTQQFSIVPLMLWSTITAVAKPPHHAFVARRPARARPPARHP